LSPLPNDGTERALRARNAGMARLYVPLRQV
jgi:hypothetical protein